MNTLGIINILGIRHPHIPYTLYLIPQTGSVRTKALNMFQSIFITIILSIICLSQASNWNLPPKSTAVVTGGTKGIGYAIVSELGLTFGCKILTCARNESELNACVEEWRSKGMDVRGCVADISTTEVSVFSINGWKAS